MTTSAIDAAQDNFFGRYLNAVRAATGSLPLSEDDPAKPSPCFVGPVANELRTWRPVRRDSPVDALRELEAALGATLHADLRAWFGRWWSLPIEGAWHDETVVLGCAASESEFEELLDAACRSIRRNSETGEASVPVAALHDGRRVRVGNVSGQVWILASDGTERLVASSLAAFLDQIVPLPL